MHRGVRSPKNPPRFLARLPRTRLANKSQSTDDGHRGGTPAASGDERRKTRRPTAGERCRFPPVRGLPARRRLSGKRSSEEVETLSARNLASNKANQRGSSEMFSDPEPSTPRRYISEMQKSKVKTTSSHFHCSPAGGPPEESGHAGEERRRRGEEFIKAPFSDFFLFILKAFREK